MRIRITILFASFIPCILAAESVSEKFNLRIYSFGFKAQGRLSSGDKTSKEVERVSGIALPFWMNVKGELRRDSWEANLQADVFSVSDNRLKILPGNDAYFALLAKGFRWGFGRRSDPNSLPGWFYWKDGVEGAFVETNDNGRFKVRFDVLDFYRGFPLAENNWLLAQGRDSFLPKSARSELGLNSIPVKDLTQTEFRYRAGIGFWAREESGVFYNIGIRYISLGNWGRFGKDVQEARSERLGGDKDYLTQVKTGIGFLSGPFFSLLEAFLVRGLDKTAYHPLRPEKSLPISGEAVRFDIGLQGFGWHFSAFGFLPNPDKRSKNGEILELGFVGMGTSPLPNPLLNQIWGWTPSAWITGAGLERDRSLFPTKRPAGVLGMQSSFRISHVKLGIRTSYIAFLPTEKESRGALSSSKEIFSNSFLREGGLSFGWIPPEYQTSILELEVGGFESDPSLGLREWYLLLKLGWVL
ncbi:hypothetical protein LEP1GSC047_0761 [Leptospira inadai serovar Lyme str. 10]|uniref:Capsule assembly protein Wzi n=2 Tax=Leptospira inadai serovar Lyme TaxID=293084 RepID=V6HJV8_9LEPT|nr:hypothetical protein [Leptospira inadai]EQA37180.1 hypothetical protein LEP1GSC047_0761 [Leptospira inadai serovar Lyme str. 10]PNV76626.1 hypothetical protein BES34_003330 [Leptospira inadai serovar Lyme]